MKTKWIASKTRSLVLVIMAAVIVLASHGCEKDHDPREIGKLPVIVDDSPSIESEYFWVDQGGSSVNALKGSVTLEFPKGAVTEPTQFTLKKSKLNCMDRETNLMNCSITLSSNSRDEFFNEPVLLKLHYCLSDFSNPNAVNEEDITIYRIETNGYAYSIGDCTADAGGKMISGYIDECGTFVLGEY